MNESNSYRKNVFDLASRFRCAIDSLKPPGLEDFPRDRCGEATLLLGAYLVDNNLPEFQCVCGVPGGKPPSHAWLESDGLVVDITADQYAGMDAVIVTYESRWHKDFEVHTRGPGDFRKENEAVNPEMIAMYKAILDEME